MKKLSVFIILTVMIASLFMFTSCARTKSETNILEKKVSYIDTHLYTGESKNFNILINRGKKEDTFIADGKVNEMKDFSTLKLIPLQMDKMKKDYSYKIVGEKGTMSGDLKKDTFGISFSSELQNLDSIGELNQIVITSADVEETIELVNKLKDMIDWQDVLKIGDKEFNDVIKQEQKSDKFNREIHIKFINNKVDPKSPYYWYIAFLANTNDYWALLVEPESGNVISKKS